MTICYVSRWSDEHDTSCCFPPICLATLMHNCLLQGSNLARVPPPESAIELFVTNNKGFDYGCSDFIFSWHMIFTIVFVHTYHRYGLLLYTRTDSHFCWQYLAHNCSCIMHLAWYTVNLVAFFTDKKLPDLPERPAGLTSLPLLPQSRDKDSINKEEHLPLLTGVSFENED
ncbi:hypothetical protein Peur_074250 [Populus x canadensis]